MTSSVNLLFAFMGKQNTVYDFNIIKNFVWKIRFYIAQLVLIDSLKD